jgi:hypothetical protein
MWYVCGRGGKSPCERWPAGGGRPLRNGMFRIASRVGPFASSSLPLSAFACLVAMRRGQERVWTSATWVVVGLGLTRGPIRGSPPGRRQDSSFSGRRDAGTP